MSNRFESLVESYATELQELDAAALEVVTETAIASAVGVQLDGLGTIVGAERLGLSDSTYRQRILARVQSNLASGTIEQILAPLAAILGTGYTIEHQEYPTAGFLIRVAEPISDASIGPELARAVNSAKVAGVQGAVQWHETDTPFAFDGAGSAAFDGGYQFATAWRDRDGRESEID